MRVGDLEDEEEDEEEQLEEEAQPEQQRDSSTASPPIHFTGQYRDLQHPGCVRQVHQHDAGNPGVYSVHGADGATSGACDGLTDAAWPALPAEEEGGAISVDFRPKGGPVASGELAAQDGTGGILWSDGNF